MSEREPAPFPEFDEQAVATALGTRSTSVHDVAYGEGHQFSVGRGDARLEVFVGTGLTRLTAPAVRIELFGNAITDVSPGSVEFRRRPPGQDTSLTVVADGGIVFSLVTGGEQRPHEAPEPEKGLTPPPPVCSPETAQELRSTTTDPLSSPAVPPSETPEAARTPASPATPSERPTSHHPPAAETESERISLTGRLGREPSFRTTRTGTLVGRFPLAVHSEDGTTTWHTVLAFGARAGQLQRRVAAGELARGREVDVVGYRHENERPGKDGTPRKVQEVYAVAVKKR